MDAHQSAWSTLHLDFSVKFIGVDMRECFVGDLNRLLEPQTSRASARLFKKILSRVSISSLSSPSAQLAVSWLQANNPQAQITSGALLVKSRACRYSVHEKTANFLGCARKF
ncbi:hypothetical protein [Bradyrhizobium sp. USDA 3650]